MEDLRQLSEKATPGYLKWLPNYGQFLVSELGDVVAEIPCQAGNPADGAFLEACWNEARSKLSAGETEKPEEPLSGPEKKLAAAAMKFYELSGRQDAAELEGTQSMDAPVEYMEFLDACAEFEKENS